MSDYKETLNLPKTSFSMKANLAGKEPMRLQKWSKIGLYNKIREKFQSKEKFILHDGPPYANGDIHVGHAVNKILKDMVVKSKTLSGYNAPYVPGWDCHGLPIEFEVEKKKGKPGHNLSINQFHQACRKYAKKQVERQKKDFMRLGVLGDWEKPYLTMNPAYEANVVRTLAQIIENGHFDRGYKPVHWCCDCHSALAEAEVEYQTKTSDAIYVKFEAIELEQWSKHLGVNLQAPTYVVIWTTTAWTLPANQAVAAGKAIDYVLVHVPERNENLIMAEALAESILAACGINQYGYCAYFQGDCLEHLKLKHPFLARDVPLWLADHVTTESGSGLVHTAPAHGGDDFQLAQKYDADVFNPVDSEGCFIDNTPFFAGKFVLNANASIINMLSERARLLHCYQYDHSYPHCWRHKTPLIFRATAQWFISMDQKGLRDEALKAIEQSQWVPEWGQARIASMVASRPEWCVSRQRSWGTPMPLFVHRITGELHPDTLAIMENAAQLIEQQGIEGWFEAENTYFINDVDSYERVTDTLDVWFDSGATNACVLRADERLAWPADLYLEGSDQHRGWFQTSLLVSLARGDTKPYQGVLTHGFTTDEKGRKMSKSLGNVIAPQDVVKTLGADILRLWVAAADYRGEMTISQQILKRISDTYRRMRNTARFLLANLNGFDPSRDQVSFDAMLAVDRWAVARANQIQQKIISAYDHYQFHVVTQLIHHFCSEDMGSFYLDVIKDRQYTTKTKGILRRSGQTAMYHIINALARWLAPIISFTADEIAEAIPGADIESIFLEQWYDKLEDFPENEPMGLDYWQTILGIRSEVNRLIETKRSEGLIGSPLEAEVDLYVSEQYRSMLNKLGDELKYIFITSSARVHAIDDAQRDHVQSTDYDGFWVSIKPSQGHKCVRCWHRTYDVGMSTNHPELCQRCVLNIEHPEGEKRYYV